MRALAVWMNGEQVGTWSYGRGGRHAFVYCHDWLNSPNARSLSLSMPLSADLSVSGERVAHYFENLLPDSDLIRRRLKERYRTKTLQAFDLLEAVGRDCVGAVQLLPVGMAPSPWDELRYVPLDEAGVARQLRLAAASPGPFDVAADEFRLSIAGAQEKTALLKINGQWCLPQGSTPTSHILKLPLGLVGGTQLDLSHSVENEWLCLELLAALGLPVAKAEIATFEDQKVLVLERFDRVWLSAPNKGPWLGRLPQEDFCQILGISPDQKYEADGGPGMQDCLRVLAGSNDAAADQQTFVLAQFAYGLLAATDGHAKNFSVFLQRGDRYKLAPLYDVLSAWPIIGHGAGRIPWQKAKLAMALRARNAHYALSDIQVRHWKRLAEQSGSLDTWSKLQALADQVDAAITTVEARLPQGFPIDMAQQIFDGLRTQRQAFQNSVKRLQ